MQAERRKLGQMGGLLEKDGLVAGPLGRVTTQRHLLGAPGLGHLWYAFDCGSQRKESYQKLLSDFTIKNFLPHQEEFLITSAQREFF